ncbi:MAG TPA: ATPase, T2SS/T4P/T4SS family [Lacunisphaera sp.]|nr:ATPase, T2SS/T4P/T4SS family [Lacunisphaera sp.]
MTTPDNPLLRIALARNLLDRGRLEAAEQRRGNPSTDTDAGAGLIDALIAEGAIDDSRLARGVAEEVGMPTVTLVSRTVPDAIVAMLPPAFVRENNVMPFAREGGVLQVAIADPLAVDVLDAAGYHAGAPVQAALAPAEEIRQSIERHYGPAAGQEALAEPLEQAMPAPDRTHAGAASNSDAPLIRLVHRIIEEAVRLRASDIHLEPLQRSLRVRYRVDGVMIEADAVPKRLQPAIISRLKIMAHISIAEKRVPQDGRIRIETGGRCLDLRVATLPTTQGEGLVMRLLDRAQVKPQLSELGFQADDQAKFEQLIASPDGLVLVTGPTGSGKTTTLYAALHRLNQTDRKIITVEEPVEYQMPGINQVPVNATIGMTFAAALRAMLRQAPNVIMLGEIRDRETAEIAMNAALTGHMVFSTLHTNDAATAVTRLVDLGTKPFLVAASLRAAVAQRLVRRICPGCRRSYTPSVRELHALGLAPAQVAGAAIAHGAGCPACHGTGYRGRLGLFEILEIDPEARDLIYDNVTARRLREHARSRGMGGMRADGLAKILAGLTTIEEVVSVTAGDMCHL